MFFISNLRKCHNFRLLSEAVIVLLQIPTATAWTSWQLVSAAFMVHALLHVCHSSLSGFWLVLLLTFCRITHTVKCVPCSHQNYILFFKKKKKRKEKQCTCIHSSNCPANEGIWCFSTASQGSLMTFPTFINALPSPKVGAVLSFLVSVGCYWISDVENYCTCYYSRLLSFRTGVLWR